MSKWVIDPDHSVAAFVVRHMMVANMHGQFNKLKGVVHFNHADISNSSVELSIDVSGIYTGIQKRDDHLRSPDFLDVEKYPYMTFKSTKIFPLLHRYLCDSPRARPQQLAWVRGFRPTHLFDRHLPLS